MLERLAELLRAFLHLLEQPCVLDCYDGLVGEGFEQLNVSVGERPILRASNGDDADGLGPAD